MRAAWLFWVLVVVASCRGGPPVDDPSRQTACVDRGSCEAQLAKLEEGADAGPLVARLETLGAPGWRTVWRAVQEGTTVPSLPVDAARGLPALHGLGRAAGRRHVVLEVPSRHLFPIDDLVAFGAGLEATVAADPGRREADAALVAATDAALRAAKSFDYERAAIEGEQLRARVRGDVSPELSWRGRLAVQQLASAGLLLEADEAPLPAPDGEASSPYSALLAVRIADEPAAAYASRKEAIESGLAPTRAQALGRHFAPAASCPEPFAPPMESAADLIFAERVAEQLDLEASPDASDPRSMAGWLPRYERMVAIVKDGHAWSHVGVLLQQRGEVDGLSAADTQTYRAVSELASAHIAALAKLFAAEPDRASLSSVLGLAFRPGILRDPATLEAMVHLVEAAVRARVLAAEDEERLFEAAGTAFAAGGSFPGPLQGAQLGTLLAALDEKLGGRFGERAGWRMAGLHAAHGAVEALLGRQNWAGRGATRVARSLRGDDLPFPELGRVARAAARYAGMVGTDALAVAPPTPSVDRQTARDELTAALRGLSPEGPRDAADRALLTATIDLVDGTIATLAARLQPDGREVRCGETAESDELRSLRRARRTTLSLPAFRRGDGPWRRRVRVVALLASDAIDVAGAAETLTVNVSQGGALLDEGLGGWLTDPLAKLVVRGYRLARAARGGSSTSEVAHEAVGVIRGLDAMFGGGPEDDSLLGLLAEVGTAVDGEETTGDDVPALLTRYAEGAYTRGALDQGDLLLLLAMSVARGSEQPVPPAAVRMARDRERPVLTGLLMQTEDAGREDPTAILEAMRASVAAACHGPDPSAVIAVRRAVHAAQRGQMGEATTILTKLLERAEKEGLVVPRQKFTYHQASGQRVFDLSHSLSFGHPLLANAGRFQLGIGYRSSAPRSGGLEERFVAPGAPEGRQEAARFFAHASALNAVYAHLAGDETLARGAARRAVNAWLTGVRLGDDRVPSGRQRQAWLKDAPGVIAVLAQLHAEAGRPFLAGDLWTLVASSFSPSADAAAVKAILTPLPAPLAGVDALGPVVERTQRALGRLAERLPCAGEAPPADPWLEPSCIDYSGALALRVANALPSLPRLRAGAAVGRAACASWEQLDRLLRLIEQRKYDAARFSKTLATLREQGHPDAAAVLLTRQRHAQHCDGDLLLHARELSADEALGRYLRADLTRVVIRCDPRAGTLEQDVLALDALTEGMADPSPSFHLLVFASELALTEGRWGPLGALSRQPGFVRRWQRMGPDLGIAALALHHAAGAMDPDTPLALESTEPFRRLLCTTFPEARRGPFCRMIDLLRDEGTPNRAAVARKVVSEVVSLWAAGEP